jgi:cell division protein WhiA
MTASFTRSVREELARVTDSRRCCRLAEVAGLVRTTGSFHIRGGVTDEERYGVHLATTVQSAARLMYSHFKAFGAEGQLRTRRESRFQRRLVYEVHLAGSPATLQALNELGVLSDSFRLEWGIPARLLKRRCCRAAFLRGCLIGAGSANPPHGEAHLEIVTPHADFAAALVRLLEGLEFHPGSYVRRGSYVVYLKGREDVAEVLALSGAQEAALQIEVQAVMKDVRARANRLANWDQANLGRTSAAALRQAEAITYLEAHGLLDDLPVALRDMAALRLEHPYLNLAELAAESPDALTRSAANHRLRRLEQAAEAAGWQPRVPSASRPGRGRPYDRIAGL